MLGAATGSMGPVGPSGWSGMTWLGLFLDLALFAAALWGVSRLGSAARQGDREEP